jgi:bacteriorhodopsin
VQIACYGALDLSAKVVWGFLFLMAHERVISTKLEEERRR